MNNLDKKSLITAHYCARYDVFRPYEYFMCSLCGPHDASFNIVLTREEMSLLNYKRRIKYLRKSTAVLNWGDDNEFPITDEQWDLACHICEITDHTRISHIGACGDGSVHIEWRDCEGNTFLLEYRDKLFETSCSLFEWTYYKSNNEPIYGESNNFEDVLSALQDKALLR